VRGWQGRTLAPSLARAGTARTWGVGRWGKDSSDGVKQRLGSWLDYLEGRNRSEAFTK
jgi:hypothetical protein